MNKVWIASIAFMISLSIIGLSAESAFAGGASATITKGVDKPIVVEGTLVTYSYDITNTGSQTLRNCVLEDDKIGPVTLDPANITLSPGEVAQTATKQTTIGSSTVDNKATLTCDLDAGNISFMSNTVIVTVVEGAATLVKTASKNQDQVGIDGVPLQVTSDDPVFFAYEIENTGTATLLNCVVTDSQGAIGIDAVNSPLVPGATDTVFSSVGQLFVGDGQNTGTLNCDLLTTMGMDDLDPPATDTADVDHVTPSLSVDKRASKDQDDPIGSDNIQVTSTDPVFFAFIVTNTSTDVPLTNCFLTDSQAGLNIVGNIPSPLAPGQSVTLFSDNGQTYADDDSNTVILECTDPWPMQRTAEDTVNIDVVFPGLDLDKQVNNQQGPIDVQDGDFVTYSYIVTNTSTDVDLFNCVVTDSNPNVQVNSDVPATLPAGQSHTVMASVFQINGPGPIINIGTVTCTDPWPMTRTAEDTVTVNVLVMPCLDLVKFADKTLIEPGETVEYTYDVTNCGDVDLDCEFVNDDKLGDVSGIIGPLPAMMGAASTVTFMQSTEIFAPTKNIATLFCTFNEEGMITAMDMETVQIIFVGGELIPIDSTALFVSGLQSSAVWLLPTIAGLAGTGYYLIKFRNKED